MAHDTIRILLIADTHLGFARHRPDDTFFANYHRALQPALRGDVDLVVHGGDVFYRSRVKPGLVMHAFEPLKRIADRGVPVVVVPGNHERSAIPFPLLAMHPRVHIFDSPRTFTLAVRGVDVAIAGFPCERNFIRERFAAAVEATGWRSAPAALRLLCIHQTVEGASVGPVDFVFRGGPDVIPGRAVPRGFAAILAGHIHRHQILKTDPPVFYPGSIERTSSAENGEAKGYVTIDFAPDADGGRVRASSFHPLSLPLTPDASPTSATRIASTSRWPFSAAR